MKLKDLRSNPQNPRTLKDTSFKKLLNKILVYPRLLEKNKITFDSEQQNVILGGNMRFKTLKYICSTYRPNDIETAIKTAQNALNVDNADLMEESVTVFTRMIEKRSLPENWVQDARGLSEEEKQAFVVIDNVSDGKWDFDALANNWDIDFEAWGLVDWSNDTEAEDTDFDDEQGANRESEEQANRQLKDVFVVPPFSILDARQGYWQEQKKAWRDLINDNGESRQHVEAYKNKDWEGKEYGGGGLSDVSLLDPVLAEISIKWFGLTGCKTFDCFAGDSIFGFVSDYLGCEFTGIELRQEQTDINNNRLQSSKSKYICDDGQNVLKHIEEQSQDLLFSCPPYYDLEVYSDLENDASNQKTYEGFLQILKNAFTSSIKCLKQNRFAVIVVGDVRAKDGFYYDFVGDVKRIFIDNGMRLYNELILIDPVGNAHLRAGRYMIHRKAAKVHQNVLVFFNGNPKEIKNIYPDVKSELDESGDA